MAVDVEFLTSTSTNNINTNFQRVKEALQETVGRNGDSPNQMNSDLDMNSNDILNVKFLQVDDLIVDGSDTSGLLERLEEAVIESEENAQEAVDAADVAVTAKNEVVSILSGIVSAKETIAIAEADAPDVDPNYYDVKFYDNDRWPNSGGIYIKRDTEPSHNGKFQNGNGTWYELSASDVHVEMFGAKGDDSTDCTQAVLDAIEYVRLYPKDNIDTIDGEVITMYNSMAIRFGPGIFRIQKDTINITQDMNLRFVGAGSRGMTLAVRARTTLLVTGTGSGYGIRVYRGGTRGFSILNMDVCYESHLFTGVLLDTMDTPHVLLRDAFFGTFGIAGGETPENFPIRYESAYALVRSTYDEGFVVDRCVFSGAEIGIWFDDVREELGNIGFGGWGAKIKDTVFYDFTSHHILQTNSGTRLRSNLTLDNVNFNPINVGPSRALVLNLVQGLVIVGCFFGSSVLATPSTEWAEFTDCTGIIHGTRFGQLANGLTVRGTSLLNISNNQFETDGLNHAVRLVAGICDVNGNRFEGATNGILVQTDDVNVNIVRAHGNRFRTAVTSSINVVSDSGLISGLIDYTPALDLSASKFTNLAERLKIRNVEGQHINITAATEAVGKLESGLTIRMAGAEDQTINLGVAHPGTRLIFFKVSDHKLTINPAAGQGFYTGFGSRKTKIEVADSDVGATIVLDAYGADGWQVTYSGTVTLT